MIQAKARAKARGSAATTIAAEDDSIKLVPKPKWIVTTCVPGNFPSTGSYRRDIGDQRKAGEGTIRLCRPEPPTEPPPGWVPPPGWKKRKEKAVEAGKGDAEPQPSTPPWKRRKEKAAEAGKGDAEPRRGIISEILHKHMPDEEKRREENH